MRNWFHIANIVPVPLDSFLVEPDDISRPDTPQTVHIVEPHFPPMTDLGNVALEPNESSAISDHLPVGPPNLAPEQLQNPVIPGNETLGVPVHGAEVFNTITDIPAADDPVWSAFDGETDLMALFPDLPSLVSEQTN